MYISTFCSRQENKLEFMARIFETSCMSMAITHLNLKKCDKEKNKYYYTKAIIYFSS